MMVSDHYLENYHTIHFKPPVHTYGMSWLIVGHVSPMSTLKLT